MLRALAECVRGVRDQAATLARYGLEIPSLDDWQAAIDAASATGAGGEEEDAASPSGTAAGDTRGDRSRNFDALAAELKVLDERMIAGETLASLKPTHDELAGNWLAQADRAQPDKDQKALFETVSHRYRELMEADDRLRNTEFRQVEAPADEEDWPEDPEALQAIWKRQRDLERARSQLQRQLDSIRWPDWTALPDALKSVSDTIARLDGFSERLADRQENPGRRSGRRHRKDGNRRRRGTLETGAVHPGPGAQAGAVPAGAHRAPASQGIARPQRPGWRNCRTGRLSPRPPSAGNCSTA